MKRLTNKQKVLRKYRKAECWQAHDTGRFIVTLGTPPHWRLGSSIASRKAAWADAARRLKGGGNP